MKKKVLRANNKPYMTKALRRAIMKRSALRNKYLKSKTDEDLKTFKKQKNFTSRLAKKERIKYFPVWNPCIGCAGCAPQGFQCCANSSGQKLICANKCIQFCSLGCTSAPIWPCFCAGAPAKLVLCARLIATLQHGFHPGLPLDAECES